MKPKQIDTTKIDAITRNIEAEFKQLKELTGANYIIANLLNNAFMMWTDENTKGFKPIDIYHKEATNE